MKWFKGIAGCLAILMMTAGCTVVSDKDNATGGLSRSKVTLELPSGVSLKPNGQLLSKGKNLFAAKITSIDLVITSADMAAPITQSIPLSTLETIIDVPSGSARTFAVTVLTDAGVTFSGSQTVDLTPGAFIDVVISIGVTGLAPAAVTASAGITQVALAWDAVPGATSYNIYWSNSAGVTTAAGAKITVTANSYTHTGLTAGTPYYYVVTAANVSGETGASAEVSAIPTPPIPAAPTGVAAAGGNAQAAVSWTAVAGAASYNVYYSTAAGVTPANGTKVTGVASGGAITGLTNGTAYYFIVTAVNAGGESVASLEVSAMPQAFVLPVPTGISATGGDAQVTISWTAVAGATSYNVYYGTATGVTIGTGMLGASGVAAATANVTGLVNGTAYFFVVTAVSAGGESGVSSEVSAVPQVPAPNAPAGVGATAGNAQATISWTAATGATSYNVYYGTATGVTAGTGTLGASGVAAATTNVTGLVNGTAYFFVVTAVNAGGESAASLEVSAMPQVSIPVAPTGIGVVPGTNAVTVSWSLVGGATSYNVYHISGGATPTKATGIQISGATTPYVHSGLVAGTTYSYVVTAVNAAGEGVESVAAAAVPLPLAPTGVTVTGANSSVSVSWTAVAGAASYNVYYGASGVTIGTGTLGASGVAATSTNIAGLTNGTTYYFIVTASNAGGEGSASAEVPGRPGLPGPTGLTASSAGSGAIKIRWNPLGITAVNISGSTTIFNISGSSTAYQISGAGTVPTTEYTYKVYWSTAAGVTPFNAAGSFTGISNNFYEQTSLANGTTYYYVVTAIDPATTLETLPSAEASAVAGGEYWTSRASMLSGRLGLSTVWANGILYAIGGELAGGAGILSAVEAYHPQSNTWTAKTSMPTARAHFAVAEVNGIIYAIGGYGATSYGTPLATVDAYNPVTDTWSAKAAMPTARGGLSAAAVNGVIYAIGGDSLPVVEAYDPVTNTWVTKAAMTTARGLFSTSMVNGVIYAIGGGLANGNGNLTAVEAYDPKSNTWATKASLLTARGHLATAALNGIIYAFAGITGSSSWLASVEAYNPSSNTWTALAAMPAGARFALSAAEQYGVVYVVGGYNGANLAATEVYIPAANVNSNTWVYKSSMATARSELALCSLNGKIYAIGGWNGAFLSSMEEYDIATGTWTNCGTPAPGNGCPAMSTPRSGAVCAATGGKVHVMGGYDGASYLTSSETYDPALNTWSTMGFDMSVARYNPASAELNGKAYVMGGKPSAGTYSNALDIYDYTGPPANRWTLGGAFATSRYMAGAESYGGEIFLMGGVAGATYQDIQSYDPVGAVWTSIGNMPLGLYGFGISNLNGLFYISGGTDGAGKLAAYAYDPATNTWKTLANMPATRWYHKSVAVNGKIYVVGGAESGAPAATMLEYTP